MLNLFVKTHDDPMQVFWLLPHLLAPRLLGLVDRDPRSRNYGCCDRGYWRYKFTDFPNARYQEIGLVIALLASTDEPGNRFRRELCQASAEATVRFWLARRHPDGSVDEAYPNERSFCATSFSAWSMAKAARVTGIAINGDAWRSTAEWLLKNRSRDNPNQNAASALSLALLSHMCGEEAWLEAAADRALELTGKMGARRCFLEYGGEDMGYHSITASLLGQLLDLTRDGRIGDLFADSLAAFACNLDESGRATGGGWSRGTQFIYPYALATAGDWRRLRRLAEGIRDGIVFNPLWQDDRYMIAMCADYLSTFGKWRAAGSPGL